jgi:hypothetical protein
LIGVKGRAGHAPKIDKCAPRSPPANAANTVQDAHRRRSWLHAVLQRQCGAFCPGSAPRMLTRSHTDHEVALQAAALVASAGDVVRGLQMLLPDKKQAVVMLINANTALPFNQVNAVSVLVVIALVAQARWAARTRRAVWCVLLVLLAVGVLLAWQAMGLNAAILSAFAPDLALVVAVAMALLCLPAAWRAWAWAWAHRAWVRSHGVRPP